MFRVFKRTISLRRFFWVPTTYVLVGNKEIDFRLHTLSWRPGGKSGLIPILRPLHLSKAENNIENKSKAGPCSRPKL